LGAGVNITRTLVFCLSAALAALSGALGACVFGSVSADSYNYVNSLLILAVLSLAGAGTLSAAVIAPAISVIPLVYLDGERTALWFQLAFGVAAVLSAVDLPGRGSVLLEKALRNSAHRLGHGGPAAGRLSGLPTPQQAVLS
jgi:ABC-type branched-subunit amino acid transport system permease subunit